MPLPAGPVRGAAWLGSGNSPFSLREGGVPSGSRPRFLLAPASQHEPGAEEGREEEPLAGTPLHDAASGGHPAVCELLLARGAAPNAADGVWHGGGAGCPLRADPVSGPVS